jgi:hypothetical protein
VVDDSLDELLSVCELWLLEVVELPLAPLSDDVLAVEELGNDEGFAPDVARVVVVVVTAAVATEDADGVGFVDAWLEIDEACGPLDALEPVLPPSPVIATPLLLEHPAGISAAVRTTARAGATTRARD